MGEMPLVAQKLSVTTVNMEGHNEVRVCGDLDVLTVPDLDDAARPAVEQKLPLVVDLTDLSSIDSTGLGYLIRLFKTAARDEWELALRRPRPSLFTVFEIAALDRLFTWTDDDHGDLPTDPRPIAA